MAQSSDEGLPRRPWGGGLVAALMALAGELGRGGRAVARRLAAGLARLRRAAATVGDGRREALIMAGAYGLYNAVRGLWGGTLDEGRANADGLVELERSLGVHWEPALQRFFVDHGLAMPFWSALYLVSQIVALPLTLILVFLFARRAYAALRGMALIAWCAGLVWYAVQPVAPPRLMADPLADTVSAQTPVDLESDFIQAFYNPVAAMPSLHVGLAVVVGWALWALTPWWPTRLLGLLYPVLIAISIVVTGNHWILDIAGGLAVVLPAAAIAAWLVRGGRRAGDIRPADPGPAPP
ncbi:phosphatase PAP2 family protein [Miltoncostaea marina]|uniref:phosphatase PAP2 family protein n=1 Tax=Miltoncostaea marina TaxID=2843215 RepID=UPI001C3E3601|nr:phosphatase PAP2 family protein [Miltoncostaea marina]